MAVHYLFIYEKEWNETCKQLSVNISTRSNRLFLRILGFIIICIGCCVNEH